MSKNSLDLCYKSKYFCMFFSVNSINSDIQNSSITTFKKNSQTSGEQVRFVEAEAYSVMFMNNFRLSS